METQLFSNGRIMGIGLVAASAAIMGGAMSHAQAVPYSGTNAINFMFAYSGEGAYTTNKGSAAGYAAVGGRSKQYRHSLEPDGSDSEPQRNGGVARGR